MSFTYFATCITAMSCSLWIRRWTWSNDWQAAITFSIALQLTAFILVCPWGSYLFGPTLYALTGAWNLEDAIGHDLYLVAASAILYHCLWLLSDDEELQRRFKLWIEAPCIASIPLLLFSFLSSSLTEDFRADLFAEFDGGQRYWSVLTISVGYLLLTSFVHFALMVREDGYGAESILYAFASLSGVSACILRMIHNICPWGVWPIWIMIACCTVTFSLTSAWLWWKKKFAPIPARETIPA